MADLKALAEANRGSDPARSTRTENHPQRRVWHRARSWWRSNGCWPCRRRRRCAELKRNRIRRHPEVGWRFENQRHQRSPRHHRPGPQRSKRPGRSWRQSSQRRRRQGRSRRDQRQAGSSWRRSRAQVIMRRGFPGNDQNVRLGPGKIRVQPNLSQRGLLPEKPSLRSGSKVGRLSLGTEARN